MWWKLAGLAFLEAALIRWLSEPVLTRSVLYYPERPPIALEPSLGLQSGVYGAGAVVIVFPFLALRIVRRASAWR